jgi:hypothetical protein
VDRRRTGLLERLQGRRAEIEQTILTRVYSVSDPTDSGDREYVDGLHAAVSAAVDYGLIAIEERRPRPGPIPDELLAQARRAANNTVSLDTVLRRYFAGYTLLADFVMQEAEEGDLFEVEDLQDLAKVQAMLFDRLVDAISDEYQREAEAADRPPSLQSRRAECVRRLLAGQLANASELDYDLEAWHIGVVAAGAGGADAARHLAGALDRRLLVVCRDELVVWAWLGGGQRVDCESLASLLPGDLLSGVSLAIGHPAHGLAGWRLTHQQAAAAFPIAAGGPQRLVRYGDVALLASMLQDEVLTRSLDDLFLAPLADDRDEGATLRATLRAYFAAERNVSCAASALGVGRKTVTRRLRDVEQRLGRSLGACAGEVEAALRLEQVGVPKRDS